MGYTKIIKYGETTEIYKYILSVQKRQRKTPGTTRRINSVIGPRRADNIRQLRKSFLRLVSSNLVGIEYPVFLTLTFENLYGPRYGYKCTRLFFQRLRTHCGEQLRFIYVPEFQKRGAVHFHALVWGIPHDKVLTERTTRFIAKLWGYGFIDILQSDGSPKLAGYLAKYMVKGLADERLRGFKGYSASRNCYRPEVVSGEGFSKKMLDAVAVDKSLVAFHEFDSLYLGKGQYYKYVTNKTNDNLKTSSAFG